MSQAKIAKKTYTIHVYDNTLKRMYGTSTVFTDPKEAKRVLANVVQDGVLWDGEKIVAWMPGVTKALRAKMQKLLRSLAKK